MKTKELARANQLSTDELNDFLKNSRRYEMTSSTFGGTQIRDEDANAIVEEFKVYWTQKQADKLKNETALKEAEERKKQAKIAAELYKKRALAEMLITSGFNFDGYTVTKYSGYISGDDAVQVDRGREGIFESATNVGDALMANLTVIRRNALAELKEQAFDLGCNAIIGVDFDYLTLDPETVNSQGGTLYMPYVFGVTANGNAVVIDKN